MCRGSVEVVIGDVTLCCFQGVIKVQSFSLGAGGVHGEEAVFEDVAVMGMETIEEVGVFFFLGELVGGTEGLAEL
jgi:hypothetical protein